MTERKRGRPSGTAASELRATIRLAAIDLFAERGFDGVSLSQIAARAGSDTGLIRYYFGSKSELWETAIGWLAEIFAAELAARTTVSDGSPTDNLKSIIRAFIHASATWPQVSRVIVFDGDKPGERGDFIAERLVLPFYQLMSNFIAAAKADGTVPDVSVRTIFFMITHGGSFPMALPGLTNAVKGGDIGSDAALEAHADAVIALIVSGEP